MQCRIVFDSVLVQLMCFYFNELNSSINSKIRPNDIIYCVRQFFGSFFYLLFYNYWFHQISAEILYSFEHLPLQIDYISVRWMIHNLWKYLFFIDFVYLVYYSLFGYWYKQLRCIESQLILTSFSLFWIKMFIQRSSNFA